MNYEQDIRIDENGLDVEWLDQPRLMMAYTRHAAMTQELLDEKKEELNLTKAELDLDIRENPSSYKITCKITETVISNTILLQPEYRKALKAYNITIFENNVAQGAVKAFDQRKSALEQLVKLHGQSYFAGPSVPRDLSKEWVERETQKNIDSGVGAKLNKKKK